MSAPTQAHAERAALKTGDRVAVLNGVGDLVAVERIGTKLILVLKTYQAGRIHKPCSWSISTGMLANGHRSDGGVAIRPATSSEIARRDLRAEIAQATLRAERSDNALDHWQRMLVEYQRRATEAEREIVRLKPPADAAREKLEALQAQLAAMDGGSA